MRNECNIICDILPLYVEGIASADTVSFVEEHIKGCAQCRAELENMKNPNKLEEVASVIPDHDVTDLKAFKKKWNKRKTFMIGGTALITAVVVLLASYFIGSGFIKRTDVVLAGYSVSEDGTEITINVGIPTSMGYIRGFEDKGGGVKPHYLTFYSTFGGLNSSLGAKHQFEIDLEETDTEIYFNRSGGGYELVLVKDSETGDWIRPAGEK